MIVEEAIRHFEESLGMETVRPGEFPLRQMLGIEKDDESYELYMYGGGKLGQIAYKQFKEQGIIVKGIIDRNADKVCIPAPVYTLEEAAKLNKNSDPDRPDSVESGGGTYRCPDIGIGKAPGCRMPIGPAKGTGI